MSGGRAAPPVRRRIWLPVLAGVVLGCAAVLLCVAAFGGSALLELVLVTPAVAVLIVGMIVAVFVSAIVARLWPRPLRPATIVILGAAVMFALAAAGPLYLISIGGRGATGPLFG